MSRTKLKYHCPIIDRHGKARQYFRYRGRLIPLPAEGTPEFLIEYGKLLARVREGTLAVSNVTFIKGTVAWVIDKYREHDWFKSLKPGTRKEYGHTLENIRRRTGDCLFSDFDPIAVRALRDKVRQEQATSTADRVVGMVGILWDFAAEFCEMRLGANPTRDVMRVHTETKPHLAWPADLIQRFEAEAKQPLRLALALLLYTGQRAGDVIKMKWADIVGDTIMVCPEKTDRKNPDRIPIPIHPKLAKVLDVSPRNSEYILTSNWKRPYANSSTFSHAIDYVLAEIKVTEYDPNDFTAHGLRKNAGEAMAEAGCTENEIMAVLGHLTSKMAQHYIRKANRGRLARSAMTKRQGAGDV